MRYLASFLLAMTMCGVECAALVIFGDAHCPDGQLIGPKTLTYLYETGEIGPACLIWSR